MSQPRVSRLYPFGSRRLLESSSSSLRVIAAGAVVGWAIALVIKDGPEPKNDASDCERVSAEAHSLAEHRATRVHKRDGLSEILAGQIVGQQPLLRFVTENVEHVQQQLDTSQATEQERPRHAHVEQSLRRQAPRARRLEQDALLVVLRNGNHRRGRPGFAAEVLEVGRDDEARSRY